MPFIDKTNARPSARAFVFRIENGGSGLGDVFKNIAGGAGAPEWTLRRAETDYWYYKLTGDEEYREKAFNGYMSNISKVAKSGKTYSCYCADYIKGGGFTRDCAEVKHEIRLGKPKLTDSGLTRYVWIRAFDELFGL